MKQSKCESCGNIQDINLMTCLECSEEMSNEVYDATLEGKSDSTAKSSKKENKSKKVNELKTVGARYIGRMIIGFLIIISYLNSTYSDPSFATGKMTDDMSAELLGYNAGRLFIVVLGVWLIYSGYKKRHDLNQQYWDEFNQG